MTPPQSPITFGRLPCHAYSQTSDEYFWHDVDPPLPVLLLLAFSVATGLSQNVATGSLNGDPGN